MSLHLEFEPHSWYMGFAIKKQSNQEINTIANNFVADNAELYLAYKEEMGYITESAMDRDTRLYIRKEFAAINHQSVQKWLAFTDNGNTGYIDELHSHTLAELKQHIKQYRANEKARGERLYK